MESNEQKRRDSISKSLIKRWKKVPKKKRSIIFSDLATKRAKSMTAKERSDHARMMATRRYAKV